VEKDFVILSSILYTKSHIFAGDLQFLPSVLFLIVVGIPAHIVIIFWIEKMSSFRQRPSVEPRWKVEELEHFCGYEDEQKPPEPKFLKVTESLCSPLSFKEQLAVAILLEEYLMEQLKNFQRIQ
jgi:hypothetical protein